MLYLFAYTAVRVRIIIDIVGLNSKKKVSPAVVVCIISVIQIQKDLRFFRAAPFAFVAVGNVIESTLSAIRRHPHPRLPVGRLKSRKNKKSAFGGKKSPATPVKKQTLTVLAKGKKKIGKGLPMQPS